MQFSDTSGRTGIIQYYENYTSRGATAVSGTTAELQEATNYANEELRDTWSLIFRSTGLWLFDDSNFTDLPQATASLTSGTSTYALPTEAVTIERIEVQDTSGNWNQLTPFGLSEIPLGVDEWKDANGIPREYRMIGNTIELFPAPNYSQSASLKVYFQRGISAFATSDTTKTPGFISEFHNVIPLGAAIRWLEIYQAANPSLQGYRLRHKELRDSIGSFYANRYRHKEKKLKRKSVSWK